MLISSNADCGNDPISGFSFYNIYVKESLM